MSSASTYTPANGWFIQSGYFLTDKLQVLGRYDTFDPNTYLHGAGVGSQVYTAGLNYYLSNPNARLTANYVLVDNGTGKNSNRLVFMTQYLW